MHIIVTGDHGYIGSVMVPTLLAAGHVVSGLDTLFYAGCDFGPDQAAPVRLKLDIRDVTPAHLAGYDAIVHLAALSNDPLGDLNEAWTYDINLQATLSIARAAKAAGVRRFIYASSCSIYGASGPDDIVTEDVPLKPLTPYAETKARAEEGLAQLADSAFSPVFLRNATAYGVSPRLRVDLVLNNLVGWAWTTGKIHILSDGSPWRPIVHIEDISRAVVAMLAVPSEVTHNQAFNIGANSENYQVRELAAIIHELVPHCAIEYAGHNNPDPRSYRVDFTKLTRTFPELRLGWTARTGAQELLSAYERAGLTLEQFQGRRYIRIQQLKYLLSRGRLDDALRWSGADR
jgi:nucleoside-diphosphate-sugar epimerase